MVGDGKALLEKDPILRRIVEVIVKEIDPDKTRRAAITTFSCLSKGLGRKIGGNCGQR